MIADALGVIRKVFLQAAPEILDVIRHAPVACLRAVGCSAGTQASRLASAVVLTLHQKSAPASTLPLGLARFGPRAASTTAVSFDSVRGACLISHGVLSIWRPVTVRYRPLP